MPQATVYHVHPEHPERHKIRRIAEALREGALMAYPTDTVHALGCDPRHKGALERLRALKSDYARHHLTLLCPSLAEASTYAYMDDTQFKLLRALTPGPFTFILDATKEVPRLVLDPKRRKVGIRIPESAICAALMDELGFLLVQTSAKTPEGDAPESLKGLIDALGRRIEIIIDDERPFGLDPSTVLELTGGEHEILREGLGMDRLRQFIQ